MGTVTTSLNGNLGQCFWYGRDITPCIDHIRDLSTIKGIGYFFRTTSADVQLAIGDGNTGLHIEHAGHTA